MQGGNRIRRRTVVGPQQVELYDSVAMMTVRGGMADVQLDVCFHCCFGWKQALMECVPLLLSWARYGCAAVRNTY